MNRRDAVLALSAFGAPSARPRSVDAFSGPFRSTATGSEPTVEVLAACRSLCPWVGLGDLRGPYDREPHGGASAEHLHDAAIRIARYLVAPVVYRPHSSAEAERIAARARRMLASYRTGLGRAIVRAPAELRGDAALALRLAEAVHAAVRAGELDGDAAAVASKALSRALRDAAGSPKATS